MLHRFTASVLLVLTCSCVTTHEADLHYHFHERGLEVTQDEAPAGARPLQVISYYKSGFYLFGQLPVVAVELEEAIDYVTERAVAMEADGIAHLSFQYEPASFFKFTLFPLPDWSSWIHVSGMAYQTAEAPAPVPDDEPGLEVPQPDGVSGSLPSSDPAGASSRTGSAG